MDKLMQVFQYNGAQVRTAIKDGEPWFSVKDVCDILEVGNVTDATSRLDKDEFGLIEDTDTLGRRTGILYVSESGLYALVLGSRKPEAREFKRWVTHEVIPSIRKTGSYGLDRLPTHLETAKALVAALEKQALLEAKIEHDAPMVDFAKRVKGADGCQNMNQVAKALGWGEIRLFAFLRDHQPPILMSNNMPLQKYIERDYFRVVENVISMRNGDVVKPQTLVTPKGLIWLQSVVPPFEANKKAHRSGKAKPEGHWPQAIAGARS